MISSPPTPEEQRVQEDLIRLEAYRSQLNALVQQHQYLSVSRADHLRAREALEGLDRGGAARELLLPLGGETFVRGRADDGAKVLIGLGSGIVVEVEPPRAVELLVQRIGQIEKAARDIEAQLRALEERISVLSERLDAAAERSAPSDVADAGDVGRD